MQVNKVTCINKPIKYMFDGHYVIFDDSRYVGLVSPRQASLLNINCPDVV